ncbi:AAA family ATPase [Rhizobium sp. CC-YZS058]|uniref:AAA family ATPase n=1 Tax=Rhizobium sp. CC-YZS058 TaxID=3042153 RepID=UPI002B051FE3|nr:AAA family ATPase [Rhizobium sp. CC-YZS058]MEA3536372.1 AAA family ATPase [Rhizobium sp. CC-YZS058]
MARQISSVLRPPFLKRVWIDEVALPSAPGYPFNLPMFANGFEVTFQTPVTIIVGENGTGKSTFLEGLAGLIGFDQAGGGAGYRPVDHSGAIDVAGDVLRSVLRAGWLPKVNTGWFFKAETFFSVARYLDDAARDARAIPPDFLSHSHGEGFLRFFGERCLKRGIFLFDEPESALSPTRQLEFLRLIAEIERAGTGQLIIATHAPLLMAYPGATLLETTRSGFRPIAFRDTTHFRVMEAFFRDPEGYLVDALAAED